MCRMGHLLTQTPWLSFVLLATRPASTLFVTQLTIPWLRPTTSSAFQPREAPSQYHNSAAHLRSTEEIQNFMYLIMTWMGSICSILLPRFSHGKHYFIHHVFRTEKGLGRSMVRRESSSCMAVSMNGMKQQFLQQGSLRRRRAPK
jgi:hypothetical protein